MEGQVEDPARIVEVQEGVRRGLDLVTGFVSEATGESAPQLLTHSTFAYWYGHRQN